jgi:hypothetical protein
MPAHYGHSTLNLEESIGLAYEFDRGDCWRKQQSKQENIWM